MSTRAHGIVVGYDGSPESDEAARWAAGMALLRGEPVLAVVVVEPLDAPRTQGWPESWWEDIERRAGETLSAAGAPDFTVERRVGRLVHTLLDAARSASMLVLGSSGHSRVAEIVIGSASQSVARHARCPVVVVRHQTTRQTGRIIVGSDDSEPSRRALDFACDHAAASGQQVVMVRAWKPLTLPLDKFGDFPPAITARLIEEEEALNKSVAEERGRYPDLEIVGEFIATSPGRALVDASYTATMVVVGSRGHSAVTETLIGSVSHHVLHEAVCPVTVVH
jgi:nucleotide-binding universal stress UspA family protein